MHALHSTNTDIFQKGSRISVAELAGKFSCQAPLAKEDEAVRVIE